MRPEIAFDYTKGCWFWLVTIRVTNPVVRKLITISAVKPHKILIIPPRKKIWSYLNFFSKCVIRFNILTIYNYINFKCTYHQKPNLIVDKHCTRVGIHYKYCFINTNDFDYRSMVEISNILLFQLLFVTGQSYKPAFFSIILHN